MNASTAPTIDLTGRIILITGAAGSLGQVAAKALAGAGAQLILLDKSAPGLERLSDEIAAAGDPLPALYPLDYLEATEADYDTLAGIIEQQFGALHGLIHCAGDLGTLQPVNEIKASTWQTLLLINLTAPFLLTRALFPILSHSHATIAFTSDSSARGNKPYWSAYGVAKNALEGLVQMWADEQENVGTVRMGLFIPGPTRSAIRRKSHPGELLEALPPVETLGPSYVRLMTPGSEPPAEFLVLPHKHPESV